MLHEFLLTHRADLIERCRAKVAGRPSPKATPAELEYGVPLFLSQLIETLKAEPPHEQAPLIRGAGAQENRKTPDVSQISTSAGQHGLELLKQGFTIDQVVHGYGDICQAVTELAAEIGAPITVDEFRTLNRCLDDAIASAVTQFTARHESALANGNSQLWDERMRVVLHEMTTQIHTAELAITAIKSGNVGLMGATGAILDLSMVSMRSIIERSLPELAGPDGELARH